MRIAVPLSIALLLVSGAPPAFAQDHSKDVWITQADSGEVLRGRMVDLSGESLSLLTADNRRIEVPLDHVLRIEARGDSVKNGALIGAAVMGVLGAVGCLSVVGDSRCVTPVVFNTIFGGLAGAGIDAANHGRSTLYSRPSAATAGKTAGVQFRVRF